jgi:competence protein ComEC
MIDVGQGDAFLVRWEKTCLWIDYGTKKSANFRSNIFLSLKQSCHKSWFALTHLDVDHSGGLSHLKSIIQIQHIVVPFVPINSRLIKILKSHISLKYSLPDELKNKVEWLWPHSTELLRNANDTSLVLKIWDSVHQTCAIFTADISQEVEKVLVSSGQKGKCFILKIAHHGSKSSTSNQFLEWIRPKIALISSGWRNPYHHPNPLVLDRLESMQIQVFRTDLLGKIKLSLIGKTAIIQTPKGTVVVPLHASVY